MTDSHKPEPDSSHRTNDSDASTPSSEEPPKKQAYRVPIAGLSVIYHSDKGRDKVKQIVSFLNERIKVVQNSEEGVTEYSERIVITALSITETLFDLTEDVDRYRTELLEQLAAVIERCELESQTDTPSNLFDDNES